MARVESPSFEHGNFGKEFEALFQNNLKGRDKFVSDIDPLVHAWGLTQHEVVWGVMRGFAAIKDELRQAGLWDSIPPQRQIEIPPAICFVLAEKLDLRNQFNKMCQDPDEDSAVAIGTMVMYCTKVTVCSMFPNHPYAREFLLNSSDEMN